MRINGRTDARSCIPVYSSYDKRHYTTTSVRYFLMTKCFGSTSLVVCNRKPHFHFHQFLNQFWSIRKHILFQTVQSTNPLTEEEHNFLDHIEQKIHQQAAKNAEEARQRQVCTQPSIFRSFFELVKS